jgi:transcriptional regulator with XRE-family HTH domain
VKGTPGGNRLKALREYAGKPQLEVELDANLGIGYLQRVESGKVRHPERDTLERILAALNARYTERRDILELFGYVVDTPLPSAEDIAWAVSACQAELDSALFPAYLLDCGHRLLAWNVFLPKLFKLPKVEPPAYISMLRLVYDARSGVIPLVANPDMFFLAQIRALRYEMQFVQGEVWCQALIDELRRESPLFERYWQDSERGQQYPIAARPLFPMELNVPEVGHLRFWLTSEPFAQDRRFRVIYYLPADSHTMQQCVAWLQG